MKTDSSTNHGTMSLSSSSSDGILEELPTTKNLPKSELPKKKIYNLNKIFEKPYAPPNIQKNELFVPSQLYPYSEAIN